MGTDCKIHVAVEVLHREDGRIEPRAIIWDDGRRYEVDRILSVDQRAALRAGGAGMRYTVRVLGKERYLFMDGMTGRWFVEGR